MGSIFNEFKRRHVFRVGLAYLVIAWLVLQVANILTPLLGVPLWVNKAILLLLVLGFPVAIFLAWAFELTPDGVKRTDTLDEAEPQRRTVSSGRKLDFVIIAGLIAALGYFVWHQYYGAAPSQTAEQGTALTPTSAAMPTLAVLPFANLSDDKKQDYFADGLSEELLDKLANLKGLQVAGRTSSFYFKGKNEDLRVIGEKLGVENLLEGSVRKSGDQLRITAQLINAKTGYHLWSQTYDKKLQDIFAIQDDISKSVADALSVALGVGDLGRVEGGTRNVEAYDAYLKGQLSFDADISISSLRGEIDSLERAVDLDPSYALAWAAIARAARYAILFDDPANRADLLKKSQEALERAQALAPDAVPVLAASAQAAARSGNWTEAARIFRKAIDLHGDTVLAKPYAYFLLYVGKGKTAVGYLEEIRRIDPLDKEIPYQLRLAYALSGKMKEALAEGDRGARLGAVPSNMSGGALELALGAGDRGGIKRAVDTNNTTADPGVAINIPMMKFLDHPEGAGAELQRLYDDPHNAITLRRQRIAFWAAYFGDTNLALSALKSVYYGTTGSTDPETVGSLFSIWDPVLSDTRKLPGFKDLVRKLGLVNYWKTYGWGDFCHPVGDNDFECE